MVLCLVIYLGIGTCQVLNSIRYDMCNIHSKNLIHACNVDRPNLKFSELVDMFRTFSILLKFLGVHPQI